MSISNESAMMHNCAFTESVSKIAEEELGETENVRSRSLERLKKRIEGTNNFDPRMEDNFLMKFLRVAKFNDSKALEKLKFYYKQRKEHPEFFKDLYPSAMHDFHTRQWSHYILPYRNTDNSAIAVSYKRLSVFDPSWTNLREDIRLDLLLMECATDHPVTQVCGITVIVDLDGTGLLNVLSILTPKVIRTFLNVVAAALPARYKSLHFVNVPRTYVIGYNILYPFLTQKLRKRVVIHPNDDNWKSLHSHISPDVLPKEFGGKRGPMDRNFLKNMILEKEHQFRLNLKFGFSKIT